MYGLQDWAAVQRVYKQTHSKRETAKVLGISRNTVKKLLELKEEPAYKRTVYKSCLDEYKELIIEWRCEPYVLMITFGENIIIFEKIMSAVDGINANAMPMAA